MTTNETHQESSAQGDESGAPSHKKGVITAASNQLSRRSFFGRMGASTALAAATSAALPALLLGETAKADEGDGDADDPASRREKSYRLRQKVALAERDIPTPPHIPNGDEKLYLCLTVFLGAGNLRRLECCSKVQRLRAQQGLPNHVCRMARRAKWGGAFPAQCPDRRHDLHQERSRYGCFWPRGYCIPGLPIRSAVAPHPRSAS